MKLFNVITIIGLVLAVQISSFEIPFKLESDFIKSDDFLAFIEYPLKADKYINNHLTIDVSIGNPPQKVTLSVDSGSDQLMVMSKDYKGQASMFFDTTKSTSIKETGQKAQVLLGSGQYFGRFVEEYVSLPNDSPILLKLAVIDQGFSRIPLNGVVGLGRTKGDQSFMQNLYKNGKIRNVMFSTLFDNNENGTLVVGEYPKVVEQYMTRTGRRDILKSCNLNQDIFKNKWTCNAEAITIGIRGERSSITIMSSYKLLFDTGASRNVMELSFLTRNLSYLLKVPDFNQYCSQYTNQNVGAIEFYCRLSSLNNLPPFSFSFGEHFLEFSPSDYFEKVEEGVYMFQFVSLPSAPINIIGQQTLKKLITIFNEGKQKIEWVHKNDLNKLF